MDGTWRPCVGQTAATRRTNGGHYGGQAATPVADNVRLSWHGMANHGQPLPPPRSLLTKVITGNLEAPAQAGRKWRYWSCL